MDADFIAGIDVPDWMYGEKMMNDHEYIDVEYIKYETDAAFLFVVDGEEIWLPKSQLPDWEESGLEVGDEDVEVCITHWIAEQKGLL